MGGVQLVDWCTYRPIHRAFKTMSCSRLHPGIVHAWVVFDRCIFGPTHRALKTSRSGLISPPLKNIGAIIRIGEEIWCLQYAGILKPSKHLKIATTLQYIIDI